MKPFYPVDMKWPITQRFGENVSKYPGRNGHPGIDFGTPVRQPVYAVDDGIVTAAGYRKAGGYGREIFLQIGNLVVIYGHLIEILVYFGDKVKRGQVLGYTGGALDDPMRGNSSGPHLHFEIRDLKLPQTLPMIGAIDPEIWLKDAEIKPEVQPESGKLTVITDHINIRIDPSTNKPAVGRVTYGMDLTPTGKIDGNWHEVAFWVNDGGGEYLE